MRTILLSGGSGGIGNAIAKKVLKEGHQLSIGLRDVNSIRDDFFKPYIDSGRLILNEYDAYTKGAEVNWVDNTIEQFHKIDTLIHCSGILHKTGLLFDESELKDIDELFKVNVMSPWLLARASWKFLKCEERPRIIVLVSMSGKRSKGDLAGYTMSKFALMGLCQTMRNKGWDNGIRVTAICPSWVNTKMARDVNSIDKSEMSQPEDIALIASNLLKLPNGSVPFEISLSCNLEK